MLRLVQACGATAVLCLAAGCSSGADDPPPVVAGSAMTSAPVTSTPTPTPPLPAAPVSPADLPRTSDGAIAFMQIWFQTLEHAYATGDTASLKAISASDCDTCNNSVSKIDAQYSTGGSFRGVHAELAKIAAPALDDDLIGISVQIAEPPSQDVSADGTVEKVTQAHAPYLTTFWVDWLDDHWIAAEVVKVQS